MEIDCYIIYMPYKDPEKQIAACRAAQKRYYQNHIEQMRLERKIRYRENIEYFKAYYKANSETIISRGCDRRNKKIYRKNEQCLIENYDKAVNFKGWILHHRLELTINGEYAHSVADLKRLNMYYNRPYFELIYLTRNDHAKLHYCHTLSKQRTD